MGSPVERAGHRVTFVIIDSSVDHGGKVGQRAARVARSLAAHVTLLTPFG